jgi:hypothetical protein
MTFTTGGTAMSERKKPIPIIKLSHRLIERTLDALGIPHCRDDDDDIFTVIPGGDSCSDLLCWFLVDGNILQLVCTFNAKISKCDWMAALLLCNAYHRESRFGRAVLHIRDGQEEAALVFETAIDCSDGLHEAFLQTYIVSHVASACRFYTMVQEKFASSQSNITVEDSVRFSQ